MTKKYPQIRILDVDYERLKNTDEIIHFLLRKILRKRLVFDYVDLKRALKVRGEKIEQEIQSY